MKKYLQNWSIVHEEYENYWMLENDMSHFINIEMNESVDILFPE